jgi:hypothetical protein
MLGKAIRTKSDDGENLVESKLGGNTETPYGRVRAATMLGKVTPTGLFF